MTSLAQLFRQRVNQSGDSPALWYRSPTGEVNVWTWRQLDREVALMAGVLRSYGVQPGDRVAHWSDNRPEWVFTDLALHRLGAVHVPMHAPLSWQQVDFQAKDCGAKLAVVATSDQGDSLRAAGHAVISYDADLRQRPDEPPVEQGAGEAAHGSEVATILYTSGTTGAPKGVMLTIDNLVNNAATMDRLFAHAARRRMNFLPLSHIFARTCDLYTWIIGGGELAVASSREKVLEDCLVFEPETLNGVPYFFQKLQSAMEAGAGVHQLLGKRIRYCCSGGAPLPVAVYDFFQQAGVPVLQGYGLTETSPVISACTLEMDRRGSVGKPIPGTEARIHEGEIQVRGPHVMQGYYGKTPVDPQQWFPTGDLGRLDAEGYLFVTGRRKEIIVLSTGKNVAPTLIESRLVAQPLIEQAMVVGNDHNYLTALVFASGDSGNESPETRQQRIQDIVSRSLADLGRHEQVRKIFLLPRPLSMEEGELTPKLSLKRETIETNWRDAIDSLYATE